MKLVIVGFGNAGKHYLNILKNYKNLQIYVIDNLIHKSNSSFKLVSFNEILKKNILFNYAIISSPSGLHYKHAKFFLERKTNVLIEKPFVLRIDHAKKLIKISNFYKVKCWTALQNRYNKATKYLKYLISNKKIGKVQFVDCSMYWHRDNQYYQNNWRGNYSLDGGVLTNQGIHLLDMLILNFGRIKYFNVIADFDKKKLKAEDLISINFKHHNGILSSFKATTRADKNYQSSIDVIGSKKRVLINGLSLNHFNIFKSNTFKILNSNSELFDNKKGPISGMGNGHKKILNEFISNNKISSLNIEISKNIYLLKVIHSIYNSIHKKKIYSKISNNNSLLGK